MTLAILLSSIQSLLAGPFCQHLLLRNPSFFLIGGVKLTIHFLSDTPDTKLKHKTMASFKIILGSSSASRKQILSEMGYHFTIMGADKDEKLIRREKPEDLVMALAEAKADAIIVKLKENGFEDGTSEPTLLITADQVVLHGGEIREKPRDADEARQFIKGYSKGHASTVGSVMVTNLKTGVRKVDWDKAEIYFHEIPEDVIDNLVGTIDSVMGLPKALTERLIKEVIQEL